MLELEAIAALTMQSCNKPDCSMACRKKARHKALGSLFCGCQLLCHTASSQHVHPFTFFLENS